MEIWIVWLPNVWKSTLFNAITKSYSADSANFPFCTIEPNVWVVDVKDARVDQLAEISESDKKIYATIDFVDIAGLVKGASDGEWLWNQFLANIREVDAIVQVVRHFEDDDVVHVEGAPSPLRDIEIINTELILADLQMIEKALAWLERKAKSGDKETIALLSLLERIQEALNAWKLAIDLRDSFSESDLALLKPYNFLTFKPFIYALNVAEKDLKQADTLIEEYQRELKKPVAVISAKFESDILDLDEEEKQLFIDELGGSDEVTIPTLDDLIALAYDEVGLMYYFTSWKKETKARAIPKWSTAPEAAWAIHTDFQRWFIKAEVVKSDQFIEHNGRTWAKEQWVLKLQWKDYIVQDGDVIMFKFNT